MVGNLGPRCSPSQTTTNQSFSDERGALALFAALILLVLVGFIALSIDSARLSSATEEKRNTADQVALAALETYFDYDVAEQSRPRRTRPPRRGPQGPLTTTSTTTTTTDPFATTTTTSTTTSTTVAGCATNLQCQHQVKFSAAVARAEQIGAQNTLTSRDGEAQLYAGALRTNTADTTGNGTIASGRWWTRSISACTASAGAGGTNVCPCAHDFNTGPCFQACDPILGCRSPYSGGWDSPFANAMRVVLRTAGAGQGIRKIFGSLISAAGDNEWQVQGSSTSGTNASTAFALPKYGVVMVDLSRSTTVEDYNRGTGNPPRAYLPFEVESTTDDGAGGEVRGAEYAYQLAVAAPGCTPAGGINSCTVPGACAFTPVDQTKAPGAPLNGYQLSYERLLVGNIADNPMANEYRCFQVSHPGGSWTQNHLVAVDGPEPEPHGEFIASANRILQEFQDRGNPADRLSLIGFDDDFSPNGPIALRSFPRNSLYTGEPGTFIDPTHPQFQGLVDMTANDATGRALRAQNLFVPRSNAVSDLPMALQHAFTKIEVAVQGQFNRVDPFVVLITNGLSGCSRGPGGAAATTTCLGTRPMPAGSGSLGTSAPAYQNPLFYEPSYNNHVNSLTELLSREVNGRYRDTDAKFVGLHVLYGGRDVVPHSVLIKDMRAGAESCLRDDGLRRLSFVNTLREPIPQYYSDYPGEFLQIGMGYTPRSYSLPGFFLYQATASLQGWFVPLRDPCPRTFGFNGAVQQPDCTGEANCSCDPTDAWPNPNPEKCPKSAVDHICRTSANPGPDYAAPPFIATDPESMVSRTAAWAIRGVTNPPNLMDSDGRLLCDPQERTIDTQVGDFVKDLMESRPIYLVE
ncbi:MAG: hypothetical protein IT290_07555 [Deltaproteobacteria bacterium]|nr:hypothetical protein [Deltaproteobacteria bacterium]